MRAGETMLIEGRKNIAKYLYMSSATLGRRLRKDGIPYMWAETRDTRGRRCMKMTADTEELDAWMESSRWTERRLK